MTRGWRTLVVALPLLLVAGCTTIESRLSGTTTTEEIAQRTADFYAHDVGDECCSVAIVSSSGTVFANAGSVDEHSLYRIASLTKVFLHPILLKLHREGRLNLDRPVTDYSRLDLPPEYGAVTLRELLENRSGLPREFLVPFGPVSTFRALACGLWGTHIYSGFDSREDFAEEAWNPCWRLAVRRKREVYSNVGFGLLGTSVEDALGKSLEEILHEELVVPLKLDDTAFEPKLSLCSNRMTRACAGQLPWLTRRGRSVPDHRLGNALRASGGIISSATDCAKMFSTYWVILDEQLRQRSIDAFEDDAVFGLLRVKKLSSGRRVLYRAGMIYGGASFVGFDPQSRVIVVILRNVTSWPDDRGFTVMERISAKKQ